MLSELQGANRQNYATPAPQGRAAVSTSAPAPESVKPQAAAQDAHAANVIAKPIVQAPKPVEIKVDIEKMRANLQDSLEKLNESMRDGGRNLNFSMDEKLGGLVILVKNADTGEVVRQIPSDAVVRMAHSLDDLKGVLHNELS
jgi:flagellar protein FlaG